MINTIYCAVFAGVGVELEDEDEGKELLMLMLGRWLLFKKKREY
jgi:hypothetical protein